MCDDTCYIWTRHCFRFRLPETLKRQTISVRMLFWLLLAAIVKKKLISVHFYHDNTAVWWLIGITNSDFFFLLLSHLVVFDFDWICFYCKIVRSCEAVIEIILPQKCEQFQKSLTVGTAGIITNDIVCFMLCPFQMDL